MEKKIKKPQTKNQVIARTRNWSKARLSSFGFNNFDVLLNYEIYTKKEREAFNSIHNTIKELLKDYDDTTFKLTGGIKKPHVCCICGVRSNVEHISNAWDYERNYCLKHFKIYEEDWKNFKQEN